MHFDRESYFINYMRTMASDTNIARALLARCDLDDSKFLHFWYNNRLIKVKDKDKIKCWRQLGNIVIFKIMKDYKQPPVSRANPDGVLEHGLSTFSTMNVGRKEYFNEYKIHIKDLLIALSRRAIIYDNIVKEIEFIYDLEVQEWQSKMMNLQNEAEKAALKKPRKPNLAVLDIMTLRLTHKKRNISDINRYFFTNLNDMEIQDYTHVFKELSQRWDSTYPEYSRMNEFLRDVKLQSKNNRFEWVMLNPGKIYSFRAICV
jgi:hypothetical protein